jgi:uncharacterized protein YhfF
LSEHRPLQLGNARTPLRRELVEAVLTGRKTATAGLLAHYVEEGVAVGQVGDRRVLLGYEDEPVAIVEITEARVVPAQEIDVDFARDEGEGFASVEEWRVAHERFFEQAITGETQIVAVRFRVTERL